MVMLTPHTAYNLMKITFTSLQNTFLDKPMLIFNFIISKLLSRNWNKTLIRNYTKLENS